MRWIVKRNGQEIANFNSEDDARTYFLIMITTDNSNNYTLVDIRHQIEEMEVAKCD